MLFYYFHFVVFLPHSAQKLLFTGNIPRGVFWNQIDWKKAEEQVNRLQIRIVKATLEQKWRLIKRLQYLITNSFYAKALTVRRVVTNSGKKTPGIDGVLWKADKEKMEHFLAKLNRFIQYLQEKPESRSVEYLAEEKHPVKCCYRCGYVYEGGNICPKCGSRNND